MTIIICDQGTRYRNVASALHEIFPNTRFTSRDSTAIDITWLVTGLVTVNGTENEAEIFKMVPDQARMVPSSRWDTSL